MKRCHIHNSHNSTSHSHWKKIKITKAILIWITTKGAIKILAKIPTHICSFKIPTTVYDRVIVSFHNHIRNIWCCKKIMSIFLLVRVILLSPKSMLSSWRMLKQTYGNLICLFSELLGRPRPQHVQLIWSFKRNVILTIHCFFFIRKSLERVIKISCHKRDKGVSHTFGLFISTLSFGYLSNLEVWIQRPNKIPS